MKKRSHANQSPSIELLPVTLLLDDIRSLYNVGSIFRTADGAGISKILLCGYTPRPPRKEIEKTALGATATVPWDFYKNPLDAIAKLKTEGVRICVLERTDESRPHTSLTSDDFPVCIVAGNEITGVSERIIGKADVALEIPMRGFKQSLNVAVAVGVALYECVRVLGAHPSSITSRIL